MIIKCLLVFMFYKDMNSFSSHAEFKDTNSPKPIIDNTKTMKQKPSRSYISNPLFPSKETTESIFPDVIYPTSILDVREPFYFTSGFDDLLKPFSDDVKISYKALNSEKEKKSNLAKYKPQPIQNMKSHNTKMKAIAENNINNNHILNFPDEATQEVNKTKIDIDTSNNDLLNFKDEINFTNMSYNLDNVINSSSQLEIELPLEITTSVIQCMEDNTTNQEILNTKVPSNNLEERSNKSELESDVNITATGEDYDKKAVLGNVKENEKEKNYVNPEAVSEQYDTNLVAHNEEEFIILKVFNESEVKRDDYDTKIVEILQVSNAEAKNDANTTAIEENCFHDLNDTVCFEWIRYNKEKIEDEFNHCINYGSNITKSEFLRKLLKMKATFESILHILRNCNDTDHVLLNNSLIAMDTIIENVGLNDYYDNKVGNNSLHELFLEREIEAVSSAVNKLCEMYDGYVNNVEEETIVKDNMLTEIITGILDDTVNSSSYDKRKESIDDCNDDVAFDVMEIICEYPEESYVKSCASSVISTFDGFKSNNNPFLILFHHFPSSIPSDL